MCRGPEWAPLLSSKQYVCKIEVRIFRACIEDYEQRVSDQNVKPCLDALCRPGAGFATMNRNIRVLPANRVLVLAKP